MLPYVNIHTHRPTGRGIELRTAGIHPWEADSQDVEAFAARFADKDGNSGTEVAGSATAGDGYVGGKIAGAATAGDGNVGGGDVGCGDVGGGAAKTGNVEAWVVRAATTGAGLVGDKIVGAATAGAGLVENEIVGAATAGAGLVENEIVGAATAGKRAAGKRAAGVQAIGETGLDFACPVSREAQFAALRAQLTLARRTGRPVVLHCVRAFEPLMRELDACQPRAVIFHGFIGSPEQARQALRRGYYLSFGARAFASPKTLRALHETPLGQLFFETDDAEVTIEEIYARAAEALGRPVEELQRATLENYKRLFETQNG